MATAIVCPNCEAVISVIQENLPPPLDKDMGALVTVLELNCPNCHQKDNFSSFTGSSDQLTKIAEEKNLKWEPSPEFGKDYFQAIRNLLERKGG